MFVRSLFWERTVLALLERVQQLPSNVQAEIANRVGGYIDIADAAGDERSLEQFAAAAVKEREEVIAQGVKSQLDQRWAAPALAEAWCVAKLGLANGSLSRHSAIAVMSAIEAFAPDRSPHLAKDPRPRQPSLAL
jgi:hypothetical protein